MTTAGLVPYLDGGTTIEKMVKIKKGKIKRKRTFVSIFFILLDMARGGCIIVKRVVITNSPRLSSLLTLIYHNLHKCLQVLLNMTGN